MNAFYSRIMELRRKARRRGRAGRRSSRIRGKYRVVSRSEAERLAAIDLSDRRANIRDLKCPGSGRRKFMSYDQGNRWTARATMPQVGIDVGLRDYMLRVYNYMAGGLAITGAVAYIAAASGFYQQIFGTALYWVVVFAPLALVLLLSFRIQSMSLGAAQLTFWAYAGLVGLSLSGLFIVYTGASIAQTFFITAATFLAMSLYGYTTRTDLMRFGSFLIMGLVGVIIASVINFFLHSPGIQFAISVIGVLVFVGLTAWDTQRIKEMYWDGDSSEVAGKKAIMGALALYLDFINLFVLLMQLMGQRRN
jgi:uncharacterized protein